MKERPPSEFVCSPRIWRTSTDSMTSPSIAGTKLRVSTPSPLLLRHGGLVQEAYLPQHLSSASGSSQGASTVIRLGFHAATDHVSDIPSREACLRTSILTSRLASATWLSRCS